MYTVSQLARLGGLTARAIRHYDEMGLLKPSRIGQNGYRYYDDAALLRFQQILFFRELGLSLAEIGIVMGRRDFDLLESLKNHRRELERRRRKLNALIDTVDKTMQHMQGANRMNNTELFSGFSPEQEQAYTEEAAARYDAETVRVSAARWKNYSKAQKEAILAEGQEIYQSFAKAIPQGPASPAAQALVERWRKHMDWFWTPALDQLVPLASHYVEDARFKAGFDRIDTGLASFVLAAVQIYVAGQR